MRKKRGSAVLSVVVSAVLAVSLCPALALADEVAGEGQLPAAAEQPTEGDEPTEGELVAKGASESAGEGEATSMAEPAAASVAAPLSLGTTPATVSAGTIAPVYDWYGDGSATEFTISTAADLLGFANVANGSYGGTATANTFEGKTIKLADNINLGGVTWTPVQYFKGKFDGNGKTISNFVMGTNSSGNRSGFFNMIEASSDLEDVRVCDLTIADVTATVGNARFGTLANSIEGVVENVNVKNVKVTTTHKDAWPAVCARSCRGLP